VKIRVDIRNEPVDLLPKLFAKFPESVNVLMTSWQWSAWNARGNHLPDSRRVMVVVPDFLYYARLASTGQPRQILEMPKSIRRVIKTGIACIPTGVRIFPGLATGQFWAAAEALLAYDLGLLERGFQGEVVLHNNLTDFMWLFERRDFLQRFTAKSGQKRWGVATQQLPLGLSSCERWGNIPSHIIYATSHGRSEQEILEIASSNSFGSTRWIVDLTQWPTDLIVEEEAAAFYRNFDNEWLVSPKAIGVLPSLLTT